jgi:ESS family glutamate:Na+ symporter
MTYNVYGLLMDLAFASGFILIGQFLRTKVRFFQEYFIPSSLIAGALGLLCGPNGFKWIPFSNQIGSYAGLFIIFVFVAMGIRGFEVSTKGWKQDVERVGSYLCFKEINYGLQYTVPFLFSVFFISQFFDNLHPGFGMILPAGWVGGHGTAAAIGSAFAKNGWEDAIDLGMTSATAGMLTGIFVGVIMIKWATKNGYTSYITDFKSLPVELKTGLIPEEKREAMGKETISSISLDPLAWHFALIMVPAGIGYLLTSYISKNFGFGLPTYSIAFLTALALSYPLKKLGVQKYMDKKVFSRIAGSATDYLVFFGLASIKLPIIVKYAVPLSMLMLLALIMVTGAFLYFSPRLNKQDWFERGIFVFGYMTGVYAIGFLLSRIVDPDMKSKTFEDTAMIVPMVNWVDVLLVSVGPILLCTGKMWWIVLPMIGYLVFFLSLPRVMKWWNNLPLARREMKN